MKANRLGRLVVVVAILGGVSGVRAAPLGTGFTYQGQLKENGAPANGLHDLRFRLFDASAGGAQVGTALCANNVSVANGLFTVPLDFGAQFAGEQRFLEIEVRADTGLDCANAAGFTVLGPRQALTAAPYALGLRLPLVQTTATNSDVFNITTTGSGDGFQFNISNPASAGEALEGRTDGTGDAVQGINTGTGRAGFFQISNAANNEPALEATTNGTAGIGVQGRGHWGVTGSATDAAGYGGVFGGSGFLGSGQALLVFGDSELVGTVKLGEVVGNLGIGTSAPAVKLHVVGGSGVSVNGGGGYLQLGSSTSTHVAMDNNEIMARSNVAASTLFINRNGGDVVFGGAIDIGYEIVTGGTDASCPAGKKVIGGGCRIGGDAEIRQSHPLNNGWHCEVGDQSGFITLGSYAICANVK